MKISVVKWERGNSIDTEIYEIEDSEVCTAEMHNYSKNQIVCLLTLEDKTQYAMPFKAAHHKLMWEAKDKFERYDSGSVLNVGQIKELDEDMMIAYMDTSKNFAVEIVSVRFKQIKKVFLSLFKNKKEPVVKTL